MSRVAYWCVWLFVFVLPFENLVEVPGVGTLGKIFGMMAITIGLLAILALKTGLRWNLFHWMLLVFTLWNAVAFFWTADSVSSLERIRIYFQLYIMICIIYQWVQSRRDVHGLLAAYVLGCYVSLSNLVYNYMTGVSATWQRYAATGFNPNDMAIILVLGIPMAWFLAQTIQGKKSEWLFRLYPFLAPLGIAQTGSRNGLISMLLGLTYIFFSFPRLSLSKKIATLVIGIVFIWVGMEYLPAASLERWATTGHEIRAGTLNSRLIIWRSALEIFASSPFGGVGPGAFKAAVSTTLGTERAPHNVYLSILIELGLVGFGLFVAILAVVFRAIRQMPRNERIFWAFLLGTWLLAANSLNWEWRKQTWVLLILPVAHLSALVKEGDAEEEKLV